MKKTRTSEILLAAVNVFYIFMAWLLKPEAFGRIAAVMILFTVLICLLLRVVRVRNTKLQMEALTDFLHCSDEYLCERLMAITDKCWHPVIKEAAIQRNAYEDAVNEKAAELLNYQEYIEEWTHEIKTPLSLAALVLNNHREEMTPYVYNRMEYVRHAAEEQVARILYYARLQADHTDYSLEKINPEDCVRESLSEFAALGEEREVVVKLEVTQTEVVFDRKVLCFIISQLFSNAFKYAAAPNGEVKVVVWKEEQREQKVHLAVRNNGKGVPPEDKPFLFDKGFAGSYPERKSATGMGLYLVKKYAQRFGADVLLEEHEGWFGVELIFSEVE